MCGGILGTPLVVSSRVEPAVDDADIGIADPIVLVWHLFVPGTETPGCLDAADADDDDVVAIDDAIAILGYLFSGGPPPASPFPDPGFDPTPLGPGCVSPGP